MADGGQRHETTDYEQARRAFRWEAPADYNFALDAVGTWAEDPEKLAMLLDEFGAQIAVGIDAKAGELMVHGWTEIAGFSPVDFARQVAGLGVERIIYTDVSRDGMLSGVNVEATVAIAHAAQVRVTASGGISSIDDLRNLMNANEPLVDSVIIGKAIYENRFTLEEAIRTAEHI